MTVRKGEQWGTPVARPEPLAVAATDAALAELVAGDPHGDYGIAGGDLYLSIGSPTSRPQVQRLPIDAIRVRLDGREPVVAVAHVVARNRWLAGQLVVVSNSGYVDGLNASPRAHPNDGRLDVLELARSMPIRQRLQARRRARSGTHLPHPDITSRTVVSEEWEFDPALTVYVDGLARGRCTHLAVEVLPDYFAIHA